MKAFADLLDTLVYTTSRNRKLALIAAYLRATPDPDRGWALAALTGELDFPGVKSSTVRNLMKDRVDPVLWTLSRDFVGDTAETVSLLWPQNPNAPEQDPLTLAQTVAILSGLNRNTAPKALPGLLDQLDANGRYALIKLATGGMRIGISARLAKTAFAQRRCLHGARKAVIHPMCPAYRAFALSCWRTLWRTRRSRLDLIWRTMQRSGNGTVFACRSCEWAAKRGSIRAAAMTFRRPFPNCSM